MSADERLARSYRRLLRAYPRSYREARGLEIVTTMLDAAQPGQLRPHWRDAANLVLRGVARRFQLPGGRPADGREWPDRAWRISASLAAAAHLAFAAATGVVLVAYLVMAWKTGGEPVTGVYDPKDLVPFGHSAANPFGWVFNALVLLNLLGFLVSPLLLLVSVPLLFAAPRVGRRGTARVRLLLVIAIATSVVPLAVFTPLGRVAGVWLMD